MVKSQTIVSWNFPLLPDAQFICNACLKKFLDALLNVLIFFIQVCDNEWHHYAVNVRFPQIDLFVDGQPFKAEKKNPEVIDDWPLHPTKGINTTVTVGACWQGGFNFPNENSLITCIYF